MRNVSKAGSSDARELKTRTGLVSKPVGDRPGSCGTENDLLQCYKHLRRSATQLLRLYCKRVDAKNKNKDSPSRVAKIPLQSARRYTDFSLNLEESKSVTLNG